MFEPVFYTGGISEAVGFAALTLKRKGFQIKSYSTDNVTHLLLDVPSFQDNGHLRSGASLSDMLNRFPKNITVVGGKLEHSLLHDYRKLDLLTDPDYLAENAEITAHCAVKECLTHMNITLSRCPVLVIGWGRIGKCLGQLLRQMGAYVTIATRTAENMAILRALGYDTVNTSDLDYTLLRFPVIFNTADQQVIAKEQMNNCRENSIKIDLASKKGIDLCDVIWARGLPNSHAPESSGDLIAKTILRMIQAERRFS